MCESSLRGEAWYMDGAGSCWKRVGRSRLPSEMHFAFQTKGTRSDTKQRNTTCIIQATSVMSSLQEVRGHGMKEVTFVGEDKERRVLLTVHSLPTWIPT